MQPLLVLVVALAAAERVHRLLLPLVVGIGRLHLAAEALASCMNATGAVRREGRSDAAPALAAEIIPFLAADRGEASPMGSSL